MQTWVSPLSPFQHTLAQPMCECVVPTDYYFCSRCRLYVDENQRLVHLIAKAFVKGKPRIRVKAKSRPSTPEARNG